jgi:hypothetical protein
MTTFFIYLSCVILKEPQSGDIQDLLYITTRNRKVGNKEEIPDRGFHKALSGMTVILGRHKRKKTTKKPPDKGGFLLFT